MPTADSPINPEALAPVLDKLVQEARKHGADNADALATHGRSLSISVRDGDLEDVDNSENRDIGLRVMVGKRQACVSSSDLSDSSLSRLAERAVAMAKLAPEDPYCGLAPDKLLQTHTPDLDLFDPTIMSPETLKARAIQVEKASRSIKGVAQAEGSSASWSTSASYFVTSHGFRGGSRVSRHDIAGMAIASDGQSMERDVDYESMRWLEDLKTPETIGTTAGTRVVARLGAKQMPSGEYPILFDQRVAGGFVATLTGAISGTSIARGTSFLKDAMGQKLFSDHINIIDDPSLPRGHGSRPWDGEGVKVKRQYLIENGVLKTWLLNTSTAKQLNLISTGHASRGLSSPPGIGTSNTFLEPGDKDPAELIKSIDKGLWITEMFGPSLNQNTGDYSVGVAGFAIENGERTYPVSEVTVAGNLKEMFKTLIPANDLKFDAATLAPSLLVESLTLAGS